MEVAITVDDLPSHGILPAQTTRPDIAKRMIDALKAKGVQSVYGFINAYRLEQDSGNAEVLKVWVDAGFRLGNHTYAHTDLNTSDAEEFEKGIVANEPYLEAFMGSGDWHWFRYPFAHEGETLEKRHAVRTYLHEHGYRIAQITLDFHDYAWDAPYARCLAKGDAQAIAWLKSSYLKGAAACVSRGRTLAYMLYGRNIKHVLLLHIGAFDSVMLPALLDELTRLEAHFISLEEAQNDPGYLSDPDAPLAHGGTLLDQLSEAKHLKSPPRTEQPLAMLTSICQ